MMPRRQKNDSKTSTDRRSQMDLLDNSERFAKFHRINCSEY